MWVGWIWFGGTMLVLSGVFNIIDGLVALYRPDFYTVDRHGPLLFNLSGWGWVHITLGIVLILAGLGLFSGATWARVVAVVLAAVNAVAQLAFLPAYPIWSVVVIAVDVLVIWAITMHGRELGH
jgi:hypothetical protein